MAGSDLKTFGSGWDQAFTIRDRAFSSVNTYLVKSGSGTGVCQISKKSQAHSSTVVIATPSRTETRGFESKVKVFYKNYNALVRTYIV
jgi:hypothetical protein